MANPEHLATLKQGVPAWNKWRSENPFITPDLREESLRNDLLRVDLITPDHHEAEFYLDEGLGVPDLRGADLNWANLHGSNLRGADLYEASLHMASLTAADLGEANLAKADLTGANLRGADLSNSDFTGAGVGWTIFGNNDLSTVKGLDSVYHQGPSVIAIETIYRSKGRVSEEFLRGAGVPEDFVVYMRSLVAKPIEFYSCFISYSTKDQEFADQLYAGLQARGVRCWFAPHDIQAGLKIHEQIEVEIGRHEKLLLILSPDSMNSAWVKSEIAKAREREVGANRHVLFPIRLVPFEVVRDWECFDADTGKDSAREIREYFIPDFSNWKDHDSYQEGLGRLLRDLETEATNAPQAKAGEQTSQK